jgi:hypothetical protein
MDSDQPEYELINPFKQYHGLHIPEGVAAFRGLSPGAKLVYGRLCRYAGSKGVAFPHIPALAEEVGLGTTQTKQYVSELVEQKFIKRRRQFAGGNVYEFYKHPCLEGTEVGKLKTNNGAVSTYPAGRYTDRQSNGRYTVQQDGRYTVQQDGRDTVQQDGRDTVQQKRVVSLFPEESHKTESFPEESHKTESRQADKNSAFGEEEEKVKTTPAAAVAECVGNYDDTTLNIGSPLEGFFKNASRNRIKCENLSSGANRRTLETAMEQEQTYGERPYRIGFIRFLEKLLADGKKQDVKLPVRMYTSHPEWSIPDEAPAPRRTVVATVDRTPQPTPQPTPVAPLPSPVVTEPAANNPAAYDEIMATKWGKMFHPDYDLQALAKVCKDPIFADQWRDIFDTCLRTEKKLPWLLKMNNDKNNPQRPNWLDIRDGKYDFLLDNVNNPGRMVSPKPPPPKPPSPHPNFDRFASERFSLHCSARKYLASRRPDIFAEWNLRSDAENIHRPTDNPDFGVIQWFQRCLDAFEAEYWVLGKGKGRKVPPGIVPNDWNLWDEAKLMEVYGDVLRAPEPKEITDVRS